MGNTICFIIEFMRIEVVKILKDGIFQNFGMQLGNAIDRKTAFDGQMGHFDFALRNDSHTLYFAPVVDKVLL